MENMEIILSDFDKKLLSNLIYKELDLLNLNVTSSHFYDNDSEKDITFSEVKNIEQVLSPKGTGNIVVQKLVLGITLKDIVLVLSFDEEVGDIVLNFTENRLFQNEKEQDKENMRKLASYLRKLKEFYSIPNIFIGYEPATDEDTLLMEIANNRDENHYEIEKVFNNFDLSN